MKLNGEAKGLRFPCDFSIKVMGKNSIHFYDLVVQIVRHHFPEFKADKVQKKVSALAHYMSLTFTVHAENQSQLDNLYRALTNTREILFVL